MSVELLALAFNHDPASAARDALNVRRNSLEPVEVPEWRQGLTNPEDSVAAYALAETQGNTLTVKAKLSSPEDRSRSLEVRAVRPPPPPFPDALRLQLSVLALTQPLLAQALLLQWQATWRSLFGGAGLLGEVAARSVTFGEDGETGFETFDLSGPLLWSRGVGTEVVSWQWQFRRGPGEAWSDFVRTSHRIYTVLRTPTEPWQQQPFEPTNLQLPWTDILAFACRWAASAFTVRRAATRVTEQVFELGNGHLVYGCPINALPVYTVPSSSPFLPPLFNCTAFLDLLKGGFGRGPFVNCSDCAAIVSTFANALGCDLWQSKMLTPGVPFLLNPILAIGGSQWSVPCGVPTFIFHEVAWTEECTSGDDVFDACLKVDASPLSPLRNGVLPSGMRFGLPGQGEYRDLLAAPAGRPFCQPQPDMRQRRPVF
jgi:hypothetical protein